MVENVKGAQNWVGRAAWHYGSYYLWGDVPVLMPPPGKTPPGNSIGAPLWKDRPVQRLCDSPVNHSEDGVKSAQDGLGGYGGSFGWNNTPMRRGNSRSDSRKAASAQIAKIPLPLAQHIARVFKPST